MDEANLKEVALRVRRRHLHSHLRAWRKTKERLLTARRSREKRLHQIRLARKYHLSYCRKRLIQNGLLMTCDFRRPFFYYEEETTREFIHGMQGRIEQYRTEWLELRRGSIDPVIANLKTLLEETELIRESPLEVQWTLTDVTLEGVWIGDLDVLLNLEDFDVHVTNTSADTEARGGYQHPHVNSDGAICWNNYDEDAVAFHTAGDYLALRDLINNLLQTYNPRSPYIALDDWVDGLGEECAECGERRSSDEMIYVESVDAALCPDCVRYCEECSRDVHYHNYSRDWEMCNDCVEDATDVCSHCDERFLKQGLHTVEEDDETLTLCDTCYGEHQHTKEEEDGTDNEPESVLAPALALSAHTG